MTTAAGPRTQQGRREATIGRILDAAVAALGEVGYTATTIAEVCTRSGVSSGGVFRHFPTRLDLMVAAADEVRKRQFEEYRAGLERLEVIDGSYESVRASLHLVRAACRAPINAAWYELLGAARTDALLRARLEPMAARYHAEIAEFAAALPVASRFDPGVFTTIVFSIVHMLDGEALSAVVHPQPEQEDLRLEQVARALTGEMSRRSGASSTRRTLL
ncbi:TetR/AcrR family transcriptional regulator [Rhodococcus zopfii]|uniref:TetR/AcrR family transcriptional regulator n=1 Tax=Rhodococcus zopfii TaxID=43772 RepID=UPI0009322E61|nr:TetR/AcrR family transcriptional regulator [Rhodococcus zopfii]